MSAQPWKGWATPEESRLKRLKKRSGSLALSPFRGLSSGVAQPFEGWADSCARAKVVEWAERFGELRERKGVEMRHVTGAELYGREQGIIEGERQARSTA